MGDHRGEVLAATTATSALELMRGVSVDVVVADYHLGMQDGAWMLRRAARAQPGIGRILISGDPELDARRSSDAFDYCLRKPFVPGALVMRIRQLCAAAAV